MENERDANELTRADLERLEGRDRVVADAVADLCIEALADALGVPPEHADGSESWVGDVTSSFCWTLREKFGDGWELLNAPLVDVVKERARQVFEEGFKPEHDDKYDATVLGRAAACYAAHGQSTSRLPIFRWSGVPRLWPWDRSWWKPKDRRRNLVRAGALIIAAIERLDREAARANAPAGEASRKGECPPGPLAGTEGADAPEDGQS